MILEMDQSLDKVGSFFADLDKQDYYFYLTESMHRFIKQRYQRNNIYQKGFEESVKRSEDLKGVVKSGYIQGIDTGGSSLHLVDTITTDEAGLTPSTNEYMFLVKIEGKTDGCKVWNSIDMVQQDDWFSIKKDPFNEPTVNDPKGLFESEGILIEPVTSVVKVTYIQNPPSISDTQDCILSEHTHKEIVQLAVSLVIENIESPRVQTHDKSNIE